MLTQPTLFAPPSTTRFRCIAADPPWAEKGGGKIKRGADRHYSTLSYAGIVDVMRGYFAEVGGPDPAGCLLWMWATNNHLVGALDVMRDLGFRYVTQLVWVKTTKHGKPHPGLGQRTRQRHEPLLLGVMGNVPVPPPPNRPDSVIEAARGRHSEKPAEAYARIERACEGPRLEVFARAAREGWTVVGNEAPSTTTTTEAA
ncbi:MAG TPA: MT-A70 family methyltransferase [Myxococcota bacterium]